MLIMKYFRGKQYKPSYFIRMIVKRTMCVAFKFLMVDGFHIEINKPYNNCNVKWID